jgi:hypothetical protein
MAEKASAETSKAAKRPLWLKIVCVPVLLIALFLIVAGIGLVFVVIFFGSHYGPSGILPITLFLALSIALMVLGIINLVALRWLWKLLRKGYVAIMIIESIALILSGSLLVFPNFDIQILPLFILNLIIIAYLYMKRALFV